MPVISVRLQAAKEQVAQPPTVILNDKGGARRITTRRPVVQVTTACHAVNLRGEAFALLNALTVASPESPEAWLELAAWQCERGEEKEALRSVRQATKLGGDDIKKRAREDSRFAPVSNTWSFRWNTG